ncbi:YfhE family protein [Mesobacillus sp. AQ2]|uniref:YfhE family protein n=1 Tax=Bacillaceae TaxID=186817 RepID=UPI0011A45A62|nr:MULTISPECIES: YfhE family protein [Bacillaceae]MCM3124796.1 YfhE family protein [Mesobacillus sp. MER 33]MCM3232895.1 YfhE family protein [Mesobacillus sp. MER 48]WHX41981.1 YfhE family protein [Mesobacillus sp. AQ2]
MDKNKAPNKGLNTEQNNGLSDTQEVLYAKDFTKAVKAENKYREENTNKEKYK